MIHSGEKLDVRDQCGGTPLLAAINGSESEFANELLSVGADPKFPDGGAEALLGAAYLCNLKVARELLKRGVAVNVANGNGETPLMEAPSQRCKDGAMVQLLLDAGADPNARSRKGFNALLAAAMTGDAAGAEKLLKAGADPTFEDKYGGTPESEACDRGEKGRAQVCALVRQALGKK
jgi:ankyrin repeat protein